jgi:Holliday junction resolvasome RuvABC endonuclease subunit
MPAYRRILSLDQASRTGWAFTPDLGHKIQSSIIDLPTRGGLSRAKKHKAFYASLQARIIGSEPDLVTYEKPNLGQRMAFPAAMLLLGLAIQIEIVCDDLKVPYVPILNQSVKKFATGKGNAKKPEMVAAAVARGWTVRSDDEADALWQLAYVVDLVRRGEIQGGGEG